MAKINTYLTFDGHCREAMAFYKECFGGEIKLQTVKGSPMETHWPMAVHDNILHATLVSEQIEIVGSDMVEPDGLTKGNYISLALICKDDVEIETLFEKLAKGGKVKYPLHNFYDGKIGGVTDKFGVNWMLKR